MVELVIIPIKRPLFEKLQYYICVCVRILYALCVGVGVGEATPCLFLQVSKIGGVTQERIFPKFPQNEVQSALKVKSGKCEIGVAKNNWKRVLTSENKCVTIKMFIGNELFSALVRSAN